MDGLLGLLVTIIVVALVLYVVFWALGQIALPQPVRTIIVVVIALVLLVWLLRQFGMWV